jgi:NAD-dependent DNA ligase
MPQQEDIFAHIISEPNFDELLFDEFDNGAIIYFLLIADERYHNSDQPIIPDKIYDKIYRKAKKVDPTNKYFIGIGSDIRGGKIELPYPMGSLNQKYDNDIPKWLSSNNLSDNSFIITDKLDGISAMVIYSGEGTEVQIAFSRGNGIEGADITRHLSRILPDCNKSITIRGEVILTKSNFEILRNKVTSRTGEPYRNARNLVAGLMNAKENDPIVYDYIDFVAYEIIDRSMGKMEMLQELTNLNFLIPEWSKWQGTKELQLSVYTTLRKSLSNYEIDGIVVDVDDINERKRLNPTKETLNPEYSFKYKITDESNNASAPVTEIEFNVSKHGYLKPIIKIEPVELVGATITKCTGFNVKFISDYNIQPGCSINITRSGDVIPHCIGLDKPGEKSGIDYQMWLTKQLDKLGEWEMTENDVDAVLIDFHDRDDVVINQLIDFFDKIDAPYLGEGNITKLFKRGYDTPESIITLSKSNLVDVLGKNGEKVHQGLFDQLHPIPWYKLIGAHSTQRGIGIRKMKKLQTALGDDFLQHKLSDFLNVDGFDMKTANRAVAAIVNFSSFRENVKNYISIEDITPSGNKFENMKIVFSGWRDSELQARIEAEGGTMSTSVSSKTNLVVTPDPNSNTGKVKKAKMLGIEIISIGDLFDKL